MFQKSIKMNIKSVLEANDEKAISDITKLVIHSKKILRDAQDVYKLKLNV